jgi:flagellar L-ring protein precursor FlgH
VPDKLLSGKGSATFNGEGTVERSSAFSTTIAARVTSVLPNGDLVIEASKEVEVNREKQTMALSGIIRVKDITGGNLVSSSDIAELKVRLTGKGFIADANKPGWLFRFLQKVLPF